LKPLRVVHLTSAHKPDDIRILEKECASLARRGYDVFFVAPATQAKQERGVTIVPVKRSRGRLGRMLLTGARVMRAAMALKPDVCHIHDPELLVWVPLMRAAGKQVVYDMHENTPRSIMAKPWIPVWARKCAAWMFRIVERVFARGAWVIFAEDSYAKDYPWVRGGEVVLNMPIAEQLLAIAQPQKPEPTVAYLGAVSGDRGAFATIEALHILDQRNVRAKWLCIGPADGSDEAEMGRMIRLYSLEGRVEMHGYVGPREAWKMIAGCCCGLAVLMPRANYRESYPTKMFEYMALGIPVVVSDFPLYRAVVEGADCGVCVDPESPQEIANAIQRLIGDPGARARMGENGRQAVRERYNWDAQAGKLIGIYRRLEANVWDHRAC